MTKTTRDLKAGALNVIKTSKPSPLLGTLAFLAIGLLFLIFTIKLSGFFTEEFLERYIQGVTTGDLENYNKYLSDYVSNYMANYSPAGLQSFAMELIRIVFVIITFGYSIFIMNSVRGTEPAIGNLLDGFGMILRVIILAFPIIIFVLGGLSLYVLPGLVFLVLYLSTYRLSPYILVDNPHIGAIESMRRSRKLMKGHRKDLFRLYAGFLGWIILVLVCIPAAIFVFPYLNSALVLFYEDIKDEVTFPPPPTDEDIRNMFK